MILTALFLFFLTVVTQAQEVDLLLKNGQVIDPKNKINARMDVAISEGKIVKVEEWNSFMTTLRDPLPASFRINSDCAYKAK